MRSLLLLLFVPTVFAQPVIGPERQLTPPTLQAAAFDQRDAATASDGSGWLVVWGSGKFTSSSEVIAASRIDSAGAVLDPTPTMIASGSVGHPAVAFGSDHYCIAWGTLDSVRVRLLGRDGTLSPSVAVAPLGGGLEIVPPFVRIAWDGSRFLVAWTQVLDASFSRMRLGFALLDQQGVVIASGALGAGEIGIDFGLAAGNGEFVIVTTAVNLSGSPTANGYPSFIRASRIADSGSISGPIAVADSTTPVFSPRAAFDGHDFLIVWSTNMGVPGQSLGARLMPNNAVTPIVPFYSGPDTVRTLTWTGSEAIVTLTDRQRAEALRLDPNGSTSSLQPVMSSSIEATPSDAAWNGQRVLVAIYADGDVYAGLLNRTASLIEQSRLVTLSPAHQQEPSIASAGDGDTLVVWMESQTAMAIPLHHGIAAVDQVHVLGPAFNGPVAAWSGTEYLVVWRGPLGVTGLRLDRRAAPIDSQPFAINALAAGFTHPGVTFDGENFVVAYETGGGCTHGSTLTEAVSRVSQDGTVLDPKVIPIGGQSCGTTLSLASGTNGSLIAWNGINGPAAAFITRAGFTSGAMQLSPALKGNQVHATWSGSQFVVADLTPDAVEWLTVSENGVPHLHGSTPIAQTVGATSSSFAGALFVWTAKDVFGLRFSDEGFAFGTPFLISRSEFEATNVALADGQVVYQRTVDTPAVPWLTRIFTRDVDVLAPAVRRRATR